MSDQTKIQENKQGLYRHPSSFSTIDGLIHFTAVTQEYLNQIKELPVQEGDVLVATYPKSGTTWLSEIVWQIYLDGAVDMTPIQVKVPYLDLEKFYHEMENKELNLTELYLNKSFPRVFKTHLPYHQAPMGDGAVTKPKYIYVVRNPKDVAVSLYWHYKGSKLIEFQRSWDEFFDMFIEGNVIYGSWFDHVLGWWAHRDDPNILLLKYEDMKKNLSGAVEQTAKFLDKDLPPEVIERIAEQTTFAAMSDGKGRFYDGDGMKRRNPGVNFLRKGEVGDWRNYFSEEQNKRFDALYEHKMVGSGLELEFE